jgi:hypothetical protein
MSLEQEEKHLPVIISVCFIGNFITGGLGQLFAEGSFWQLFCWQLGSLFFMAGASLYAAKLATDKWHISSAGFILLSIGQGLFFSIQNSTASAESQSLYASGILVFLPGMIFLNYYTGFPVWVRIFGVIAILPFLVNMIKIDMNQYDYRHDYGYDIAGFLMLQIVGLFWSYYAFHPRNKVIPSKDKK